MDQRTTVYPGEAGPVTCSDRHEPDGTIGPGHVTGMGFTIAWQPGPRGRTPDGGTAAPTGAQVEDVLAGALHRLRQFEGTPFDGPENVRARGHVESAISALAERRRDRRDRDVEGTNEA